MKDCLDILKENATRFGDHIAVVEGNSKICYRDFVKLVNNISHRLIQLNANPRVVLNLQPSIESYALIVAVLNVDGTFCPLNPESPIDRKFQIISEFQPDLLVSTDNETFKSLTGYKSVKIDDLAGPGEYPLVSSNFDPDSVIYVIFTSGTTAQPKGVMIRRKSLNKFLEWSIRTYEAGPSDIWGQFSSLSFDLSIVDIFTCLCSGATLFCMNDINAKKYRPSSVIEDHRITIWHSIPSAIEFMIKNEAAKNYDFSSLRLLSFCGETLHRHQVEFLFCKKKSLRIFNTYGPTEGTLFCTWQEIRQENYLEFSGATIALGKAIPGWNIFLEDDESEEKEIVIYGEFIGKGYLNGSSDSHFSKMFVNSLSTDVFRTGDLVTVKGDNLFFYARKDRQVKIRGFRVELDEIDFWIREHLQKPSITLLRKDTLYSFIECNDQINETTLRDYLKKKLDPFKIPSAFISVKEIPRNQNQKIDSIKLLALVP